MMFRLMILAMGTVFCLGSNVPLDAVDLAPSDAFDTTLQPSGWSQPEKVYTLTNTTRDWICWQAASATGRAECNPSGGWIGPGVALNVTVRPVVAMSSAQPGTYTDQITLDFTERVAGDIDGNGHVNVYDVMVLADAWNTTSDDANFDATCDLDSDGAVNVYDVFVLVENWDRRFGV